MVALFDRAKNSKFKDKHVVPEGHHNDNWIMDIDAYFNSIYDFMAKAKGDKIMQ